MSNASETLLGIIGVYPPFGANFDSRFVSREGAKNAKEKGCDGFSVPSLEKVSSATEFRLLCVLRVLRVRNIFAPFGEYTHAECAESAGERRGFPQRRRVAETRNILESDHEFSPSRSLRLRVRKICCLNLHLTPDAVLCFVRNHL
jgi:hypothetical protein